MCDKLLKPRHCAVARCIIICLLFLRAACVEWRVITTRHFTFKWIIHVKLCVSCIQRLIPCDSGNSVDRRKKTTLARRLELREESSSDNEQRPVNCLLALLSRIFYANHVYNGGRKASVRCLSVCLSHIFSDVDAGMRA